MKKDKVDKGFELFYDNLSYRRKFIRTIWLILSKEKKLKYNYTMWKKETNK